MFTIILLISSITVFYLWLKWHYSYWARLGVPCADPTLFLGNVGPTIRMETHFSSLSDKWYKMYAPAPYFGYYKFFTPSIVLRDPDLIKDVLIKDHLSFHHNDIGFSGSDDDDLLAHNPFITTDEKWKRARNILTPLFTTNKTKTIYPLMEDSCEKLRKHIADFSPTKDVEAKSLAANFTTQNVIRCSFSVDAKCFDDPNSEFRTMGKKLFQPTTLTGLKFMLLQICPSLVSFLPISFLSPEVDKWFRNFIKQNRDSRKTAPPQIEDLLQMMLNTTDKHKLTESEIAGHSLSFFIEGYETSSAALSFAFYEIANNPDVQERLHQEITKVLSKHDGKLTYDCLQEMKYLDCVFQETQRIDTIGLIMKKKCSKAYTLPLIKNQKKPVTIPAGTPVQIPIRSLHMDPNYYPNPEVFDPNRFSDDESNKNRHKGVYLPFGEGPRMCMGMRFALVQSKAAIATVVKSFKIKVSRNHKPFVLDNRALVYQPRDGLLLNFEKRNN